MIKCNMDVNHFTVKDYSKDMKELVFGARTLVMNALEIRKEKSNYPKELLGNLGVKRLNAIEYDRLNKIVTMNFAKSALAAASTSGFYNSTDIKQLEIPQVRNNAAFDTFVTNFLSAVITPAFPAMTSNLMEMLSETRLGGIGDTFVFDIPSNEVYLWHSAARGSRSYGHDMRYMDTVTLNPQPVGTTYDIPWIRIARGEYDLGNDLLAAMLGWMAYSTGRFNAELAKGVAGLEGSALHADSFTTKSFRTIKSNVRIYNGNQGVVWALGTDLALGEVLPEKSEFLSSIGEEVVKMGFLSSFAQTPLIEVTNSFVPGTYAGGNPVRVFEDDKIYFFATGATKPIKQAIGGGMATVTKDQVQKSNKVTSYTFEIEYDIAVIAGDRWGSITVN